MTNERPEITLYVTEYFALRSPRLRASWYDGLVTVPEDAVYRAIDALRTHVAEWDSFVGDEPADESESLRARPYYRELSAGRSSVSGLLYSEVAQAADIVDAVISLQGKLSRERNGQTA
jgi:hypothetical protein